MAEEQVTYIYKIERLETGEPDYAIRYNPTDTIDAFYKMKGGAEVATDLQDNDKAYNLSLDREATVSKEEYDAF